MSIGLHIGYLHESYKRVKTPPKTKLKYHVPVPKPPTWQKIAGYISLVTIVPFLVFSSIARLCSWAKNKIKAKPTASVTFKREIKEAIANGLKRAAPKQTFEFTGLQGLFGNGKKIIEKANQLFVKIKNISTNPTMDEIDQITEDLRKLSNEFLKLEPAEREQKPFNDVFKFLKKCAYARMIPDGTEATKRYGNAKNKPAKQRAPQTGKELAERWQKSLHKTSKVSREWLVPMLHWALWNPTNAWHSRKSEKDRTDHIVYDALQGNPSYYAHNINGIKFIHSPTPSAPDDSPIFRMYLEDLKEKKQRHIHFQYQSPHDVKKGDWARIQQMDKISQKYEGTFDQVVMSYDFFESESGAKIANAYVGSGDKHQFFQSFKDHVMRGIRTIGQDQPITIPNHLLSNEKIVKAFEIAENMCKHEEVGQTDAERIAFAYIMQECLYGVLMTAITKEPEIQNNKENVILSGGCKQDVDRGPVLNLILQFFSNLLAKDAEPYNLPYNLTDTESAEMYATTARAKIGDGRQIFAKRAVHGVNAMRYFGENHARTANDLKAGMDSLAGLVEDAAARPLVMSS